MTQTAEAPIGALLLDKPPGPSSARALAIARRAFGTRRVGHTGTLDPFASGLLVALVGQATRAASLFSNLNKRYIAEISFGRETTTLDPEGEVVATGPVPEVDTVVEALAGFRGTFDQVPPVYSAVHVDGRRAYQRARAGETVTIPSRRVTVSEISVEVIDRQAGRYRLDMTCSSGTYVRSLARDLGLACGTRAYVSALRRVAVGALEVADAVSPDDLSQCVPSGACLLPLAAALATVPDVATVAAQEQERAAILQGRPVGSGPLGGLAERLGRLEPRVTTVLLSGHDGTELALVARSDTGWRYGAVFATTGRDAA